MIYITGRFIVNKEGYSERKVFPGFDRAALIA